MDLDDAFTDEDEPACRLCSCTMMAACDPPCSWVADPLELGPLCSACLPIAHVQRVGPFKKGEILVVPRNFLPTKFDTAETQMTAFLHHFVERGEPAPLIVVVDDPAEIEHLDSDEMAALGWVRADEHEEAMRAHIAQEDTAAGAPRAVR